MLVREYLKELKENQEVTFVIVKAVKDEETPFYHNQFYQTPIRLASEWMEGFDDTYIVVKKDTCPIDINGIWDTWYEKSRIKCAMIMKKSELRKQYSGKQAETMIEYYLNKY